jgi:O-antigen/teichoic acid export membrane protein
MMTMPMMLAVVLAVVLAVMHLHFGLPDFSGEGKSGKFFVSLGSVVAVAAVVAVVAAVVAAAVVVVVAAAVVVAVFYLLLLRTPEPIMIINNKLCHCNYNCRNCDQ